MKGYSPPTCWSLSFAATSMTTRGLIDIDNFSIITSYPVCGRILPSYSCTVCTTFALYCSYKLPRMSFWCDLCSSKRKRRKIPSFLPFTQQKHIHLITHLPLLSLPWCFSTSLPTSYPLVYSFAYREWFCFCPLSVIDCPTLIPNCPWDLLIWPVFPFFSVVFRSLSRSYTSIL